MSVPATAQAPRCEGRANLFTQLGVWHCKGHDLCNSGVIQQYAVYLERADRFAPAVDDFVQSTSLEQIAIFIKCA